MKQSILIISSLLLLLNNSAFSDVVLFNEADKQLLFNLAKVENTDVYENDMHIYIHDLNEFYNFTDTQLNELTHIVLSGHTGVVSRGDLQQDPDGLPEKLNVTPRYYNPDIWMIQLPTPGIPPLPWYEPIASLPSVQGGWLSSSQLLQSKMNYPFDSAMDHDSSILFCQLNKTDEINPNTGKPRVEFSFTVSTPLNMTQKPGMRFDFYLSLEGVVYNGLLNSSQKIDHPDYQSRAEFTFDQIRPFFEPYLDSDVCGDPNIDTSVDRGLYIWQDCTSGNNTWHVRATAGGDDPLTYTGNLTTDQTFSNVLPNSIEASDTFNISNTVIDFNLSLGSVWHDGFSFNVAPGNTCLNLTAPQGITVKVGRNRVQVNPAFNIVTLGACL